MMASIYAGAYITIAATGAVNNQAGLFVDGNLTTTRVPCPYGDGESVDLHLREAISHDLFWEDGGVYIREPGYDPRLPLLSRGWVHQERILSPRILHFTRDELVWECMQNSDCECGARTPHATPLKEEMSAPLVAGDWTAHEINAAWHDTVIDYTSKNLTYERDRLPALSGLAKRFCQMKPGIDYLAGLWRDSLALDLLWFTSGDGETQVINFSLPSWSWASVNGKVGYNNHKSDRIAIEILHAECDVLGPDPTGEIRSGKITLKGMIEPVQSLSPRDLSGVKMVITPFEEVSDHGATCYTLTLDNKSFDYVTIYWDTRERTNDGLYLLKGSETKYGVRFLVLINVDKVSTDRFRRIGMGTWEHSSSSKPPSRPFPESLPRMITLV